MTSRYSKSQLLVLAIFVALSVAVALWLAPVLDRHDGPAGTPSEAVDGGAEAERAFAERDSGSMLEVGAVVLRRLSDDLEGSRHQRFIVQLESGLTLLVAHNIDLARRVPLDEGDRVEIRGQYEWNERGGVLHWTHHDPQGRRPGGWIRHHGETYR